MKRISFVLITFAAILIFAGGQVFAQHGRGGGAGMGPSGHPGGMGPGNPSGVGPASAGSNYGGTRGNSDTRSTMTPNSGKSVNDLLSQNTRLSSQLEKLSGATDLSALQVQADGFKNLGQFVAAVHVSHNLGIPFDTLKGKLTGKDSVNLGKAIHELDPTVNAKTETKKANAQAKQDLKSSHS